MDVREDPGLEVSRTVILLAGAFAGLAAGLVVGALQLRQGAMVVGLIGASPAEPGAAFLLLRAVVVGCGLGAVIGYRRRRYAAGVGAGLLLGLLWWVVESLTLLPLLTGRPVRWSLADAETTFPFLIGGMLYGGLTALGIQLTVAAYLRLPARFRAPTAHADQSVRRIVVLGGGFGGVSVAQRLERRLVRRTDVQVVLVSTSNSLLFTPMLAEVAAGTLHARHISAPIRAACPQTVFHRATVEAVDLACQLVWVRAGGAGSVEALPYDHLVLALGAVPNYRGLPGVAEHSLALKTLDDAVRLRDHVIGFLERADVEPDQSERRRQLTFVVAGGGFAGVELVAELCDMVHDLRRYYPRLDPAELRFILIHTQERILPELSRELADHALAKLRDRGIEFVLSSVVSAATADAVVLADGRRIASRTVVWTAGNQPSPLLATLPFERSRTGAVACEPTLLVRGQTNVWALGDCAAIPDPQNRDRFYPPTAQHALREGKALADNVVAALEGRAARPFRFRTIGLLVALGHQQGAAEIRGRRFSGLLAWLMWRGIYLGKLPGLEKKVRVALDWTLDLFFPRDVVLAQSKTAPSTPKPVPIGRVDIRDGGAER